DFELNLSDAQETPVQAEAAPPAQPVADLMDESALPNDFGEAADLDVSDIEVEGLGFEGMDFGETTEAAAKPDSAPPADEDISLDLGGESAEPEVSLDEATEPVPVAEELALNAEEPSTSVEPEVSLDLGDEDSGLEATDAAEINLEPETEGLGLGEETAAPAVEEEPPAPVVEDQEIVFELEGDDEAPATTPKKPDTAIPEIEDLGLEIELSDDPAPPEEDTK
ncbi:MAG: hypothetical protein IID18_08765, partial [Nitrospinae bacterium]|nr:hypothetical protein [Nitrospinota bacterium]